MIYPAVRRACVPVVRTLYRLEVRGADRVPAGGPVVVAANHVSVLDPFVLSVSIERPLRYLGKAELWKLRPLARVLEALGAIPVARDTGDTAAIAAALAALELGEAVGIFPQGAVRRDAWRRGAARLALASGAPLLPVRLIGTADALRPGRVGFPRIAVLIGEPILVDRQEPTAELASALTVRLRASVESLGS